MRHKTQTFAYLLPIIILVGIVVFYSFNRARDVLFGPEITILSPAKDMLFGNDLLTLSGNARNTAFLLLNGRQIFTNEEGNFEEKLLLHYGYNIIEIEAKDRFSKTEKRVLEIMYQ